jgi:methionyl-tRNA formyltransferase
MRSTASPVKRLAEARGIEVLQPTTIKTDAAVERVAAARPQALVVAAYGLILPRRLLDIAPLGALNIHASLLPRWRGAAPIQRALMAGDAETGISIMQMDAGLDTGPILSMHRLPIQEGDDAGDLHDKLAELGGIAIVAALSEIAAGRSRPRPQPDVGVTYAQKITPGETEIDWTEPCVAIERRLRALRPAPGARTILGKDVVKLWRARCVARSGAPGTVLETGAGGIVVACGEGALEVSELQRAGSKKLAAADFLRGCPVQAGERLGAPR